jgi:hypothetical protein
VGVLIILICGESWGEIQRTQLDLSKPELCIIMEYMMKDLVWYYPNPLSTFPVGGNWVHNKNWTQPPKPRQAYRLSGGVVVILICRWELSWIVKDAAQPEWVEAFLRVLLAATLWLKNSTAKVEGSIIRD